MYVCIECQFVAHSETMPPPSSSSSSKDSACASSSVADKTRSRRNKSNDKSKGSFSAGYIGTSTRKGTVLPREKKKKKKIPLFWSLSRLVSMSNCSVLSWVFKMNYYYYSPRKFTCSGWVVWSLGIKHRPTGHALQINCTHSDYAASFSLSFSFALTSPAILCYFSSPSLLDRMMSPFK